MNRDLDDPVHRPMLRELEAVVAQDPQHGRVVVLRDLEGIAEGHAVLPPALVPIIGRFNGALTCAEIADEATKELGEPIPARLVASLARELDEALLLEGRRFDEARARVVKQFADAAVREASHAGGAYHADPTELARYIDEKCLGVVAPRERDGRRLVGLIAPHIDPWRGAQSYGHAYAALAGALHSDVRTFVVLGTSHAAMREPFALCRKAFDTPFGPFDADLEAIDALAAAAPFDPYADLFNHKREHSLEFQAVFIKHLLKEREARIVPILAGLGRRGRDDGATVDDGTDHVVSTLAAIVARSAERTVLVAGVDLAHVGPRFGDAAAYGAAARARLERADRESLAFAAERDATGFFRHVAGDLETRRVCGLAPIHALLRALPGTARGELLHYEQTVDEHDGSIVSHAAMAFYA
ncbi:AmmeMemoRadiSam system protein B [Patescibacteria group bacterium]|nr:MAG: AmmeMemoRadiSam system protein B [Patescibacteria group bacterium]